MADSARIKVVGLRDLRRDFKELDKSANRELSKAMRAGLVPILARARAEAPEESGKLSGSLRPYSSNLRAGIRSRLPYAGVQHYGGTINPRGTPIKIRATEFITRPLEQYDDRLVDDMGDSIETAARKNGWH